MNLAARSLLAAAVGLAGAAVAAAPTVPPRIGRYVAQFCVATSAAPPHCGPAQVDLRDNGTGSVRVDDVVYHLRLGSGQLEVVVMHNVVQIDEFTVPYTWVGSTLHFNDDDRHSRYAIQFPPAKR